MTPPASRVSVGGDCIIIIIGLLTRFFAAALAIEMLIDFHFVQLPKGYAAGDGYEYALMIGAVMFAIAAMRGGGPYSVDRAIKKTLSRLAQGRVRSPPCAPIPCYRAQPRRHRAQLDRRR